MPELTIAQAAHEVLLKYPNGLTAEEIYSEILKENLYTFKDDAPNPTGILKEQMRRHSPRKSGELIYAPILFEEENGKFTICATQTTMRRINRATDKESVLESLVKKDNPVFPDLWKAMVFSALLGIRRERKEPLREISAGKSIDQTYFSNNSAWPGILHLISLVEFSDPLMLDASQNEVKIQLFEQYANGGLSIIKEECEARDYDLDSILSLMELSEKDSSAAVEESI